MATDDKRERKWRKIRVVVEVTVPPNNRATEKDLKYHVERVMPKNIPLPRALHTDHYIAATRIKTFSPFWPAFLRLERGLKPVVRKPKVTK